MSFRSDNDNDDDGTRTQFVAEERWGSSACNIITCHKKISCLLMSY